MKYRIDFYQVSLVQTPSIRSVHNGFRGIVNGDFSLTHSSDGFMREIWGCEHRTRPATICGQFRKFRVSDLPEVGRIGAASRELLLAANEGLIEPNFFVYYPSNNLLAWHYNKHANHPVRFAEYLSAIFGTKVTIEPLIQPDAMRRLLRGDVDLKKISVSVARPTNTALYPSDDFSVGLLALLDGSGSNSMHLEMGIDLRRDPDGKLLPAFKRAFKNLVDFGVTSAKAKVEEDGITHTIDLIADRITNYQVVDSNGRFLPSESMYRIIEQARNECEEAINGYFETLDDGGE